MFPMDLLSDLIPLGHESSHSGEKPYVCTKKGCGQTFSNDDDRKRHENKSKKHAAQ